MQLRMVALSLAVALTGICVAAQGQEAVLLRLTPPMGQTSSYQMLNESWVESPLIPVGDSSVPMMRQRLFISQSVIGADQEVREFAVVIDSMTVETPAMPAMSPPTVNVAGQKYTMTIDTRGPLLSIEFPDGTLPTEVQALISDMQLGPLGGSISLPERPIRPGETWEDTRQVAMPTGTGGEVLTELHATYRFERLEERGGARHAVITFDGFMETADASDTADSSTMSVSGSVAGEVDLNLDDGRFENNRLWTTMEGQAGAGPAQGMTFTVRSEVEVALLR